MRWPLILSLLLVSCETPPPECEGAVIEAQVEAVNFGDLVLGPPPGVDGDLKIPERRVFFVKNSCGEPLVIDSVCLVGNTHNQDPETPAFYLELEPGETLPMRVRSGKETGIRVTFEVESINGDTTGDGVADPDISVLVIHSNASNEPVLLAPICGRAVEGGDPVEGPCEIPEGFTPPDRDIGDCIR